MIIAFCGHAAFRETEEQEEKVLDLLEKIVGEQPAEIYLGDYGNFDNFAYHCCKKYKESHPLVRLVLVMPRLGGTYQHDLLVLQKAKYDAILCPKCKDESPKCVITHRNRYVMEQADCVIAYIDHAWGGAYATYTHAKRKGKVICNLAKFL